MIPPPYSDLVFTHLNWGRDGAKTYGQIQDEMNVSRRIIEAAVEELRNTGAPVVTGSAGCWLSTDSRELEQAADRLRLRAVHQFIGARKLRETARRYAKQKVQQMAMFGLETA